MSADSTKDNVVRLHPGAGRNKSRIHLRGRQVNLDTLAQLRQLMGDQPIKRDMLVESGRPSLGTSTGPWRQV